MTDPIADLLARIRNAQNAKHDSLKLPSSRLIQGIAKILYEEGYIGSYKTVDGDKGGKILEISLRYSSKREPIISSLVRQSKPGRRLYKGYQDLKPVRNGLGFAILSTPKGILTDKQAREEKVGGELLCTVW